MQTDTAQNIFQKVPMLTEEQQKKLLEMADSFLTSDASQNAWRDLKKAIADNQIESGRGDFADQHDHYIHGTEKH